MNTSECFCLCTLIILMYSCKKEKEPVIEEQVLISTDIANGLSDNPESVHGYFYISYTTPISGSGYLTAYCAFRDPSGNIVKGFNHVTDNPSFNGDNSIGNVQVGRVEFNNLSLRQSNNGGSEFSYGLYNSQANNDFDFQSRWKTDGNGSFKPIELTVPRGFPKFVYPSASNMFTLSISQGFTVA